MMALTGKIIGSEQLDAAITRLGSLMRAGLESATRQAARGFVRREIAVTPPASEDTTGREAKAQGIAAIDRELHRVFVPIILRGKRPEQWPDVAGIYAREVLPRKGKRNLTRKPLTTRYHVDQAKFDALRDSLVARVGFLAAGWNAAAEQLGVPVPAWIARHGTTKGACVVEIEDHRIRITLTNAVRYGRDVDGFERRTRAALDYEAEALEREIEFLLEKNVRAAALI